MPAPISCSGLTAIVEAGTVGIIHHPWKSRVVAQAVKTDHRYVHKDPSICGGDPVIVGTRVPVRLMPMYRWALDLMDAVLDAGDTHPGRLGAPLLGRLGDANFTRPPDTHPSATSVAWVPSIRP